MDYVKRSGCVHSYCTLQVQLRGWITSDNNSSVHSLCRSAAHTAITRVNGDQGIEYSGINDTTVLSKITAATADMTLSMYFMVLLLFSMALTTAGAEEPVRLLRF